MPDHRECERRALLGVMEGGGRKGSMCASGARVRSSEMEVGGHIEERVISNLSLIDSMIDVPGHQRHLRHPWHPLTSMP